jgi:hypothetical protein
MDGSDCGKVLGSRVERWDLSVKIAYFVVGPYRSGTSMVCRVLSELGAWSGPADELFPPTEWNPAGYIQRPDVTAFNTWLIEKPGGTLQSPAHPAATTRSISDADFASIDLEWARNRDCVLIKDPRFCFTLAGWLAHSPIREAEIRVVRVRRNIEDAADSALSHYDVRHYCGPSRETALGMLRAYDDAAGWQCEHRGVAHITVDYEDLLADPAQMIRQIADFMGCEDQTRISSALRGLEYGRSVAAR